jgi:GNAT superfamily N-acetyltransferase
MTITVRRCRLSEIEAAPNLQELVAEYEHEAAMPEIGPANPQVADYKRLEATLTGDVGLHAIGAFEGDKLVGYLFFVLVKLPHYGAYTATVESFFVPRVERKRGVGVALRKAAEDAARTLGAKVLFISASADSAFARAMRSRKSGYRHSNEVFVKKL